MEENNFVKGLTIGCLGFIILVIVCLVLFLTSDTFKNIITDMEVYKVNIEKVENKEKEEIKNEALEKEVEEAENNVEINVEPVVVLPFERYSELDNEYIVDILDKCAIDEFTNVTYLETVDDIDVYTISSVEPPLDDIYLFINQEGSLKLVQYEKVDVYNNGEYLRYVDDFVITEEDRKEELERVLQITTNMFQAERCEFIESEDDVVFEIVDYKTNFRRSTGKIRVYRKDGSYMDKEFINEDSTAHSSIDYDNWSM